MNHPSKGCPHKGYSKAGEDELDAMTTAELIAGLEALCETMSEENYNGDLIDAYLNALDRKAPITAAPSAKESCMAFRRRISETAGESRGGRSRRTPRKIFRGGLVAAVLVVCLLSGMVAVQAAGMDVFGSIARWTGSLFSFGGPETVYVTPTPTAAPQPELTEEYLESLLPVVPEGFVMEESDFCVDSMGSTYGFAKYSNDTESLVFMAEQARSNGNLLYEKDTREVMRLELCGVEYYLFDNNGNSSVAWHINGLTCGIFSNLEKETIIGILINSYGEE